LHLNLVAALDLPHQRVSLFHVALDGRQTLILPEDQEVPLAAVVQGSEDLVRLLEPCLDLRILSLLSLLNRPSKYSMYIWSMPGAMRIMATVQTDPGVKYL
jgi:hypothetical protein